RRFLGIEKRATDQCERQIARTADDGIGNCKRGRETEKVREDNNTTFLHSERGGGKNPECLCYADECLEGHCLTPIQRHPKQARDEQNFQRIGYPPEQIKCHTGKKAPP